MGGHWLVLTFCFLLDITGLGGNGHSVMESHLTLSRIPGSNLGVHLWFVMSVRPPKKWDSFMGLLGLLSRFWRSCSFEFVDLCQSPLAHMGLPIP